MQIYDTNIDSIPFEELVRALKKASPGIRLIWAGRCAPERTLKSIASAPSHQIPLHTPEISVPIINNKITYSYDDIHLAGIPTLVHEILERCNDVVIIL